MERETKKRKNSRSSDPDFVSEADIEGSSFENIYKVLVIVYLSAKNWRYFLFHVILCRSVYIYISLFSFLYLISFCQVESIAIVFHFIDVEMGVITT